MIRVLEHWLLLPERIALHEPSATAVIADVHLGYSAARRWQGDAVPLRSVREELQPLINAACVHDVRSVIVAGDLFERGYDAKMADDFLEVLKTLRIDCAGIVPGNHDRGIEKATRTLPILKRDFELGGWRILHGDLPFEDARVVLGHWHPAVRWRGRKTPCFLMKGRRLVLPAFSLDAAGVDVRRESQWKSWARFPIWGGKVCRDAESM
jgi:putative SbcD/Mre11-related phosphoesterase